MKPSEPVPSNGSTSLLDLLSLLAPRRLLLVGPDGPLLRAAVRWAAEHAGVDVLRAREADDAAVGDLIVCQDARRLPPDAAAGARALLPEDQAAQAAEYGWPKTDGSAGGAVLLSPEGSPDVILEQGLDSYTRRRLTLSSRWKDLAMRLARSESSPVSGATASVAEAPTRLQPPSLTGPWCPRDSPLLSIIVPVYNAAAELRRCLNSLARHTTWPAELVLIDDASPDPEVADVLAEALALLGARVLSNAVNLGFTETVNRGLRATRGDVVLLNSDTEVGPRWLEHLLRAAESRERVATVTAVSDNAGAFSVPRVGERNPTPLWLDTPDVARLLAQETSIRGQGPTGGGFCMYISRRSIEAVGQFDAESFPRGYGEENDFCMRALRAGYVHLVDSRTFVAHVKQASFGQERAELADPARTRLDERYPDYTELVREFVGGPQMNDLRLQVEQAYGLGQTPRPRVLLVIHEGGGGTWVANLELARALNDEWEPLVLTSDRRTIRLWGVEGDELIELEHWTLERPIRVMEFSRQDYADIVAGVLEDNEIELVHVRHLFKHTFDLPRIAARLRLPVVFSFHDFYFTCPTVHLLDNNDTYCAATCTPGDGVCRVPSAGLEGLPHLKHTFVYQWREEVAAMLDGVDAFVTTSEHARSVHMKALPSLAGRPFELIEHGRGLRQQAGIAVPPDPDGKIRILVVANLDVHKGADYMGSLKAVDAAGRLEFHLVGAADQAHDELGIRHGRIGADELPGLARRTAPAFAGCFSVTAETYSHALTEAWAMGIPALATDLGAYRERIRAHGGGQLLPVDDPVEAIRRIYALADDPAAYSRLRDQASLHGCATVTDMSDAYAALYRRVLDGRRTIVARPTARCARGRQPGVVRMLAVVPGEGGVHPGSTYVRVVQRFRHPSVNPKLSVALRLAHDRPLTRPADVVLVQRTALAPDLTKDFIALLRERGTPLLLDLDDHLLLKGGQDLDYGPHQESVAALIAAARMVLVSTERLAEALRHQAREVVLVPNLIDERLFLAGVSARPRAQTGRTGPVQIVYVGSPTHARDLALLAPVMAELGRRWPGRFELNVVGVEPPGRGQDWYRRIVIPDGCKPYPRFVAWLRAQRPRWDFAVAPLHKDEFNRYKSDLKFLEYAALGLPAVFSASEPYATVIHGRTGLKVGGDLEQWVDALTLLADDLEIRDELADQAFEYVVSRRLLRHGAEDLIEAICAAAEGTADPASTAVPAPLAAAASL